MGWLQLTLDATGNDAEALSDWLMDQGALAATFQDAADEPLYEPGPGEVPLWSQTRVVGLFETSADLDALLAEMARRFSPAPAYYVTTLDDQDWTRAWMDHFEPMRFGRRLWIVPRWLTPPEPGAANVMLDPGMAFGTGTHPTTALCLEWLDAQSLENATVVDYGCGSGILAIAAAKLGAREVWAVDYDFQALRATRENAQVNEVAQRIHVLALPALDENLQVDVLVANILARPLIELAPRFAKLLPPGRPLALSGILADQAQQVAEAYAPWFDMSPATLRDGWARLEGVRREDARAG